MIRYHLFCLFACTRLTLPSVRLVLWILVGTSYVSYSCLSRSRIVFTFRELAGPSSILPTVASAILVAERANERASIHGLWAIGFPRFLLSFPFPLVALSGRLGFSLSLSLSMSVSLFSSPSGGSLLGQWALSHPGWFCVPSSVNCVCLSPSWVPWVPRGSPGKWCIYTP